MLTIGVTISAVLPRTGRDFHPNPARDNDAHEQLLGSLRPLPDTDVEHVVPTRASLEGDKNAVQKGFDRISAERSTDAHTRGNDGSPGVGGRMPSRRCPPVKLPPVVTAKSRLTPGNPGTETSS